VRRETTMVAAMELEILGMNFGCVLAALADTKIPDKDCLLPLISKLLGYAIVAASTTVKLPQVPSPFSWR
jgi:mannose-P-dolichol utilization defect protein 1